MSVSKSEEQPVCYLAPASASCEVRASGGGKGGGGGGARYLWNGTGMKSFLASWQLIKLMLRKWMQCRLEKTL